MNINCKFLPIPIDKAIGRQGGTDTVISSKKEITINTGFIPIFIYYGKIIKWKIIGNIANIDIYFNESSKN